MAMMALILTSMERRRNEYGTFSPLRQMSCKWVTLHFSTNDVYNT
jgi:hypothetical protein